jgi:hypothetical protein
MRRVCAFVGEDFTDAVLHPSRRPRTVYRPIVGTWRPKRRPSETEIAADNAGAWRRGMTRADRAVFEGVAGGLLAELGYETDGATRSLSRGRRLACRAHTASRITARRLNDREPWLATWLFTYEARIRHRLRAKPLRTLPG